MVGPLEGRPGSACHAAGQRKLFRAHQPQRAGGRTPGRRVGQFRRAAPALARARWATALNTPMRRRRPNAWPARWPRIGWVQRRSRRRWRSAPGGTAPPVYLVVGDSIGVGQADYDFGDRGVVGYIERGLDGDRNSKRRNFATMSISGTRPDDQSSSAPGQYELRMKALRSDSEPALQRDHLRNGAKQPFDRRALAVAVSNASKPAWWRYWRDACPACRIYQTTFPSHARSANNTGWTNAADQTTDYPGGTRWKASAWFRQGPLPDYVTTLDVTSAFCDPAHPGVWRTSDWTGALAQPISRGANHVVVTARVRRRSATSWSLSPARRRWRSRTSTRSPGTAHGRSDLFRPFAKDHPAEAAVALAYTSDGTHPSATLHKAAAAIIESYKANGALP